MERFLVPSFARLLLAQTLKLSRTKWNNRFGYLKSPTKGRLDETGFRLRCKTSRKIAPPSRVVTVAGSGTVDGTSVNWAIWVALIAPSSVSISQSCAMFLSTDLCLRSMQTHNLHLQDCCRSPRTVCKCPAVPRIGSAGDIVQGSIDCGRGRVCEALGIECGVER